MNLALHVGYYVIDSAFSVCDPGLDIELSIRKSLGCQCYLSPSSTRLHRFLLALVKPCKADYCLVGYRICYLATWLLQLCWPTGQAAEIERWAAAACTDCSVHSFYVITWPHHVTCELHCLPVCPSVHHVYLYILMNVSNTWKKIIILYWYRLLHCSSSRLVLFSSRCYTRLQRAKCF